MFKFNVYLFLLLFSTVNFIISSDPNASADKVPKSCIVKSCLAISSGCSKCVESCIAGFISCLRSCAIPCTGGYICCFGQIDHFAKGDSSGMDHHTALCDCGCLSKCEGSAWGCRNTEQDGCPRINNVGLCCDGMCCNGTACKCTCLKKIPNKPSIDSVSVCVVNPAACCGNSNYKECCGCSSCVDCFFGPSRSVSSNLCSRILDCFQCEFGTMAENKVATISGLPFRFHEQQDTSPTGYSPSEVTSSATAASSLSAGMR